MYCFKCGKELPKGASFCNVCGTSINEKNKSHGINLKSIDHIMALVGCIFMGISLVLPYFYASFLRSKISSSIMEMDDGVIVVAVVMVFIILLLLLLYFQKKILFLIVSILDLALTILFLVASDMYVKERMEDMSMLVQKGAGFYLLMLGTIIVFISGIVGIVTRNRIEIETQPTEN